MALSRLSLATVRNIAIIAACLAVIAASAFSFIGRNARQGPAPPATYRAGETMETFAHLDYAASPRTLIVYLRSTCTFCTQSMPFYRRLASTEGTHSRRYRFVVVTREPQHVVEGYLSGNGVTPDQIVASAAASKKFVGSPLLILVDASGHVVDCWPGWQRPNAEEEIIKILEG